MASFSCMMTPKSEARQKRSHRACRSVRVFFEEAVQDGLGLLGVDEQGQAVIMGNGKIRRVAVFTAAALADGHVAFSHI